MRASYRPALPKIWSSTSFSFSRKLIFAFEHLEHVGTVLLAFPRQIHQSTYSATWRMQARVTAMIRVCFCIVPEWLVFVGPITPCCRPWKAVQQPLSPLDTHWDMAVIRSFRTRGWRWSAAWRNESRPISTVSVCRAVRLSSKRMLYWSLDWISRTNHIYFCKIAHELKLVEPARGIIIKIFYATAKTLVFSVRGHCPRNGCQ